MDVIAKARAERAAHVAEIAKLDTFIEMYERLNGVTPAPRQNAQTEQSADPVVLAQPNVRRRVRGGTDADTLVEAMKSLLREAGQPMTRTELVNALETAGYPVGGADKSKNLGTIIWRSKAFDNQGDGYWPKGDEAPMPEGWDTEDLYQAG